MTVWPTVMVTGHRPQHLHPSVQPWIRSELDRLAVKLRDEHGTIAGISGMAIGADQWWAASVLNADLKLHAHVPFPQQADKWGAEDRAEWNRLCERAWKLKTYGSRYEVRTLHERNDGMIAETRAAGGAVIAVWLPSKTSGGTASAVEKATKAGLPIIHVNPEQRITTLRMPQAA